LLRQAGVQACLGRFPLLRLEVANGKEKLRPEMAGLHGEGAIERVPGHLPVAAPILLLADQEMIERAVKREGTCCISFFPRSPLLSQQLQELGPSKLVGPRLEAQFGGAVQDPERFL